MCVLAGNSSRANPNDIIRGSEPGIDITTFRNADGYTAILLHCVGRVRCRRKRQSCSAPVNGNAVTAAGSLPKIVNQIVNGATAAVARARRRELHPKVPQGGLQRG